MIYLQADIINGVTMIDSVEVPGLELLRPLDFYEGLRWMGEGDTIFCVITQDDQEIYQAIELEYGIHW